MRRRSNKRLYRRLNLRRTLFLLPNLITLSSVFCGFYAMVLTTAPGAGEDAFYRAALLIVFAMFFDALDGRVARMTKTQSAFGLQIDSLADVLSFGAAPALLIYHWSLSALGTAGVVACFLYVACGAVRLARFNVLSTSESGAPKKPSKYIVGLPIPGAAGIVVSVVVANRAAGASLASVEHADAFAFLMVALGALMVSNLRFRSFKDVRLTPMAVGLVGLAMATSVLIFVKLGPPFVLLWLLGFYVAMGIVEWLWQIPSQLRARTDKEA